MISGELRFEMLVVRVFCNYESWKVDDSLSWLTLTRSLMHDWWKLNVRYVGRMAFR